MNLVDSIIIGVSILVLIFVVSKLYFDQHKSKNYKIGTKFIVRVAIFGAISAILYILLKFPVPFFPSFLELHFDEVPAFIAGFAYGPLSAFCVLIVKTIIKLPFTTTFGVGELSDLIYSIVFIVPAALIYKKKRNFKSVFVGLGIGMALQLITSMLGNIYIMLPFYMKVMEFPAEAILELCQKANPAITDLGWTYGLFAVLPFNLMKDIIIIILTLLTYKSTHRFIDKLQN